jgi:hypothetical protein
LSFAKAPSESATFANSRSLCPCPSYIILWFLVVTPSLCRDSLLMIAFLFLLKKEIWWRHIFKFNRCQVVYIDNLLTI